MCRENLLRPIELQLAPYRSVLYQVLRRVLRPSGEDSTEQLAQRQKSITWGIFVSVKIFATLLSGFLFLLKACQCFIQKSV